MDKSALVFKVTIHTYVATQIYFNLIDDSQKNIYQHAFKYFLN